MKIPAQVWSQLGPIEVRLVKVPNVDGKEDLDAYGRWDGGKRDIEVGEACVSSQMQTLFHEMIHIALWDAGAHNAFTDDAKEVICDAVGTYLAGAALHGWLALKVPK